GVVEGDARVGGGARKKPAGNVIAVKPAVRAQDGECTGTAGSMDRDRETAVRCDREALRKGARERQRSHTSGRKARVQPARGGVTRPERGCRLGRTVRNRGTRDDDPARPVDDDGIRRVVAAAVKRDPARGPERRVDVSLGEQRGYGHVSPRSARDEDAP